MPNIPGYDREITPKPVGKAPLPVVDTGGTAIGAGLQQVGAGISNLGKSIFEIEQEKQRIRDNALIASASGDRNQQIADSIDLARRTDFTDIKQFFDFRKNINTALDEVEQNSISKMSRRAGQDFSNYAKANRQSALRQIEAIVWSKEVEFQQNETKRQYTNLFENMAGAGIPVEEMLADEGLDIIESGMSPYWTAGELEKTRDQMLIDALINVGRYEEAKQLAQASKAFTSTEKKSRMDYARAAEARMQRENAERLKLVQEETSRQMLADWFDGNLTDPQLVTDALRLGYLSDTDAKYLREAIMYPKPRESTNEAIISVRYAIKGIAEGTHNIQDALSVVTKYTKELSATDGKGFISEIFGDHDKGNAFWDKEGWDYIERQILEVSSLTGILHGSGKQVALSAQAHIAYDIAKKDAIKKGKPLEGIELYDLAHKIMLPFRQKVKPLIKGEILPESLLEGTGIQSAAVPIAYKSLVKRGKDGKVYIDSMTKPDYEQFIEAYNAIPGREARRKYYNKWSYLFKEK